jgi:hypothetical protein
LEKFSLARVGDGGAKKNLSVGTERFLGVQELPENSEGSSIAKKYSNEGLWSGDDSGMALA